jgi:hypothetical protein
VRQARILQVMVKTLVSICALLLVGGFLLGFHEKPTGRIYYVDGTNPRASDSSPGTGEAPWKTIGHAGKARELKPGDTVLIRSGVYREYADIIVCGEPGNPITFAAAPNARVVIKGSEIVPGAWRRLADDKTLVEPFPHAFQKIWKTVLGEEFFSDPRFGSTDGLEQPFNCVRGET